MPRKKKTEKETELPSLFAKEDGNSAAEKAPDKDYLTVSEFLDEINEVLRINKVFVAGEITEFKAFEQWVSFSLKDKEDGSILRCFLSSWTFRKIGVPLEDGMEIKIGGFSRVYKKAGSFSFQVESIEPLGAGSLKKAYELLLKKLEAEGLFARKRALPKFIKTIGVISSKDGVVIQDFKKNLRKLGFEIKFWNSRVEGADAVPGITAGIKWFNEKMPELDVLIIMRGGGSLESMQAFNNEAVCREIFGSKIPVLCGIGHDVDVPISSLVADLYVSTPTATAYTVNESWDDLFSGLPLLTNRMLSSFGYVVRDTTQSVPNLEKNIISAFSYHLGTIKKNASLLSSKIFSGFRQVLNKFNLLSAKITKDAVRKIKEKLENILAIIKEREKYLSAVDPKRNLRLGYSIVFNGSGKVIKNIKDVKRGETITTKLSDGEVLSEVKNIMNN